MLRGGPEGDRVCVAQRENRNGGRLATGNMGLPDGKMKPAATGSVRWRQSPCKTKSPNDKMKAGIPPGRRFEWHKRS